MRKTQRSAFTIVELLVSMALILFIMVILSQAFSTGLETFRQLKGIGDMQEHLRVATTLLRSDLAEDHFEGKRKLSDPNLGPVAVNKEPPREGFFYLRIAPNRTPANPNTTEGFDADGMPSYRGPLPGQASDALYFTMKLRGNRREKFLSHRLPGGYGASPLLSNSVSFFGQDTDALFNPNPTVDLTFNSQWAEVAWYLARTGTTVEPLNPTSSLGTPLYALYRAQYLLVPNNGTINANANGTTDNNKITAYAGVSCYQRLAGTTLYFNSPADVTASSSRAMISRGEPVITNAVITPQQLAANSSLVLSNVVSFQVRLMPAGPVATSDFNGDYWSMAPLATTPAYKEFEAATSTTNIRALQIIIRIWDPASQQTRQVTMVQDM